MMPEIEPLPSVGNKLFLKEAKVLDSKVKVADSEQLSIGLEES